MRKRTADLHPPALQTAPGLLTASFGLLQTVLLSLPAAFIQSAGMPCIDYSGNLGCFPAVEGPERDNSYDYRCGSQNPFKHEYIGYHTQAIEYCKHVYTGMYKYRIQEPEPFFLRNSF